MLREVRQWVVEIEQLAKIGQTKPHVAYATLTHDLLGLWTFILRVSAVSPDYVLQPLE